MKYETDLDWFQSNPLHAVYLLALMGISLLVLRWNYFLENLRSLLEQVIFLFLIGSLAVIVYGIFNWFRKKPSKTSKQETQKSIFTEIDDGYHL